MLKRYYTGQPLTIIYWFVKNEVLEHSFIVRCCRPLLISQDIIDDTGFTPELKLNPIMWWGEMGDHTGHDGVAKVTK